ncbi:MAG: Xaa-Pro dipeptidyl-peptidase [Liquorilactobacillus ghanensis]|uniref:Xaa-Pro dipeptidyl-peptidase n=1 Tax=Liquorilactobacillus ghanensis TaxID=399370 RepID=UPI0039EA30E7
MRNNQFARLEPDLATKITELKRINFLDESLLQLTDATKLWRALVVKAFPQAKTLAVQQVKLADLAATATEDFLQFTAHTTVNSVAFYNVALQLLDFTVDSDFSLAAPIAFCQKTNLPYQNSIDNCQDVISAWYDLLNTSNQQGQALLDRLAGDGYFADWPHPVTQPLFFNGKAQPVFATAKLHYETVYVETELDTDRDGKFDLVKVDLIRPAETDTGLKVPVLFTASPYNQGTNEKDAEQLMHKMDVSLQPKQPGVENLTATAANMAATTKPISREITSTTTIAQETFTGEYSYRLNDYFLARGFAVVYSAGIGTKDSDGLRTCGSAAETQAAKNVIEWLTGQRTAFVSRNSNQAITAWWCNGAVAMTGKSYLGTLATAVATTGVAGLKTIIAEAAISSWYDYYRDHGLVVAPGGFPGEDADVLALECFSRKQTGGDYLKVKQVAAEQLAAITTGQDRNSGNYNFFWDQRNYLKDMQQIKADVILVHGLNDWNVKLRNVYQTWQKLQNLPIQKKLILHQGQHIYINNLRSLDFTDMMNLWLSHELYGLTNHAEQILPDVLVQDNTIPEKWLTTDYWQSDKNQLSFNFVPNKLVTQPVEPTVCSFNDQLPATVFDHYQKYLNSWEHDLLQAGSDMEQHRLIFKSEPLTKAVTLRGVPRVTLKAAVNQNYGMLSLMLVDYGMARRLQAAPSVLAVRGIQLGYNWQEENAVDFKLAAQPSPWKMITKGHLNLQNRQHAWKIDELKPNTYYSLTTELQPMFYHLPAGHQLGLIIYATDFGMTIRGNQNLNYSLALDACHLKLPNS